MNKYFVLGLLGSFFIVQAEPEKRDNQIVERYHYYPEVDHIALPMYSDHEQEIQETAFPTEITRVKRKRTFCSKSAPWLCLSCIPMVILGTFIGGIYTLMEIHSE